MPTRPTEDTDQLLWATDTNYSGGLDGGTPTKSEPATGRKDQGWRGNLDGDKPPAQEWNWWMHFNAEWIEWLEAVLTVGHDDDGNHRANVIDTLQLVDEAVETAKIDALAVTTAKIDDNAITNIKMADDSVDTPEIVDEAVVRSHILEESSNFVINPDAHMGDDFWWDGKDPVADYNEQGTDTDQATDHFDDPLFGATSRNANFSIGTYFSIAPSVAAKADLSEKIDLDAGQDITLSFLSNISLYIDGTMNVDVVCYDATGKYQGIICSVNLSANEGIWTYHEASGTTLANGVGGATADTAYIRVRRWIDADADATVWRLTRIKVNGSLVATSFSDEASMGQNLSARAGRDTAQSIGTGSFVTVLFDSIFFDDPGTDRYTSGNGRFTADRYMKVDVGSKIEFEDSANWSANERAELWVFKNGVSYARIDRHEMETTPASTFIMILGGTTMVELNEGDYIDIQIFHNAGAAINLVADDKLNFLDVREIN